MKKNFLLLIFLMFCFPLFGNEITGKSMKCELEEKVNINDIHSLRGYPFYFFILFLENLKLYKGMRIRFNIISCKS